MKKCRFIFLAIFLVLTFALSACASENNEEEAEGPNEKGDTGIGQKELVMPFVSWASTVAGVNVIKVVLEDLGYEIDLKQVEAGIMFSSLADGSSDISVGAVTLPHTHKDYWEEYGDDLVDVNTTMEKSVTIGLAVPSYAEINSIEDLTANKNNIGDKLDWEIVGIDPGAGQMQLTEKEVMPHYELDEWNLIATSGPSMTAALLKAIDEQEPVVVTLWEPHWAFIEWDLKYLEDPDNIFGEPDSLHAVARKGLKEDAPVAFKVLEQFNWTKKDMGEVMVMIHDGKDPYEAGEEWVENNQDKVSEWTKDVETSNE